MVNGVARKRRRWQELAGALSLLGLFCVVAGWATDSVRTTSQSVRLEVTSFGRPVAGVSISLEFAFDPAALEAPRPFWESRDRKPDHRAGSLHSKAITNEEGYAKLVISYAAPDRTWGSTPPAWRDETGKYYRARLKDEHLDDEIIILLNPNNRVQVIPKSKAIGYELAIVTIGDPTYRD
ncbi:MAG TPA: hypothetical protein VFG04_15475 [Planctomycetaceae bacterium]|jgi:hypothetical protein|nr:hypothetical protein [Planctomycetaceae bacterium]